MKNSIEDGFLSSWFTEYTSPISMSNIGFHGWNFPSLEKTHSCPLFGKKLILDPLFGNEGQGRFYGPLSERNRVRGKQRCETRI
jgi:hypothetical protein